MFCADFSRAANEQLFGTVKPTTLWLMLEYNGRWYPKAFEDSDLPAAVKAYLSTLADPDPQTRILMIRQRPRLAPEGIVFYVALTRETGSGLYAFHLDRYEDLLALDMGAIRAGDAAYDANRTTDPLFLICTNGRRDRCCARYGIPVYEEIAALGGASVWQTSHVGGHRLAANVVCLPEGIVYGRVDADSARSVFEAHHAGQLVPALLRGRSAYPKHVQAAEALLRLETGITALDAFHWTRGEEPIRFVAADGTAHVIDLADDETVSVYGSCGDEVRKRFVQYRLRQHVIER